jgi:hypothetical protein
VPERTGAQENTQPSRIWGFKKTPAGDWHWEYTEWEGKTTRSRYFTNPMLCFNNAQENGWLGASPEQEVRPRLFTIGQ